MSVTVVFLKYFVIAFTLRLFKTNLCTSLHDCSYFQPKLVTLFMLPIKSNHLKHKVSPPRLMKPTAGS